MELNREQIIKALECCSTENCTDCPYAVDDIYDISCGFNMARDALALIKELTEENERLSVQVEMWKSTAYCEKDRVNSIKVDTVRKMQERLKEKAFSVPTVYNSHFGRMVDQIAKEMLEESDG